eukprot:TRINITY_DN1208_c0_g1_i1.p1 TRINITY_DN1208_c0_g1~~TRINITY_DN1208_c0_g1_i1.p1  ORF type:complete len:398 (-),score=107.47 TRINITY_DN1208_c0_g1_i1:1479-2672(-)
MATKQQRGRRGEMSDDNKQSTNSVTDNRKRSSAKTKGSSAAAHGEKPKMLSADYDIARYVKMGAMTKHGQRAEAAPWTPELKKLDDLGAGDSFLLLNVLPPHLESVAFETLKNEIEWNEMYHKGGAVPRLISIQGTIENGAEPLYRHPADEQPAMTQWTPFASELRRYVSDVLKQELNHALIQYYRSGNDYISAHADKTLDVKRGSVIVNLSLGATRVMVLKTKTKKPNRSTQRVTLPHNSLFVLGWETNRKWTHEIRQDKRMDAIKRPDELDFSSSRISLTFRTISTYLRHSDGRIYGQGAVHKTEQELDDYLVTSGDSNNKSKGVSDEEERVTTTTEGGSADSEEAVEMLKAFSAENRDSHFDWDKHYGRGFSLLNFKVLNPERREKEKETGDER